MSEEVGELRLDPRVAKSKSAVLAAGADILAREGVPGITVGAIVERSGVARTTIYRHWPSRAALILDIVAGKLLVVPDRDTGDVIADMRWSLRSLAAALRDRARVVALLGTLEAASHDAGLAVMNGEIMRSLGGVPVAMLERGKDAGQLPDDLDVGLTLRMLFGPVLFCALVLFEDVTDQFVDSLIDRVLVSRTAPDPLRSTGPAAG